MFFLPTHFLTAKPKQGKEANQPIGVAINLLNVKWRERERERER